ncbi:Acetyltransferase (GNAT) domain protein [Calidithermus terrae]|uniref:Acetyltransferase (GNAT) domain protein n=2 Tax=Calidithermus terrae TaxID=1408545 RepID=A0A399EHV1_9DEIN|nr:Acetyltransferase (GNAT) domain protein [Calidithermus terrae]
MVHRRHHGGGLGKRLLLERLYRLAQYPEVAFIRLDTSQHTCGFFEKLGFATIKTEPNGYAPGLDRYDMQLWLEPAARDRIRAAWLQTQPLQGEPS